MAVTITDANTIAVTGGTVTTPLLMTHITTLDNWPTGTTQATVDSYITRTATSWTFNIQAGKKIVINTYLDISDANIVSKGLGGYLHSGPGGVITGGKYISGKVFGRPMWMFEQGGINTGNGDTNTSSITGSFLSGTGQINCVGLRVINQHQQPGATAGHTAFVFFAGSGGSFNLQDFEFLSEGNSPTYLTLNATTAGSVASCKELRCGAWRHGSNNVTMTFGDGGWIGGDNGTSTPKMLLPATQATYRGLTPISQATGNYNITNLNFQSPTFIALDAGMDVSKITMYPASASNRAEVRRTINLGVKTAAAAAITGMSVLVKATATSVEKFNGKLDTDGSTVATVWVGTGASTLPADVYKYAATIVDERDLSILVRRPGYLEASLSTSGEYGAAKLTGVLPVDSTYTNDQSASTAFTGNTTTKTITAKASATYDQAYDWFRWWESQTAQMSALSTSPLSTAGAWSGWTLLLSESLALSAGTKLASVSFGTITNTAGKTFTSTLPALTAGRFIGAGTLNIGTQDDLAARTVINLTGAPGTFGAGQPFASDTGAVWNLWNTTVNFTTATVTNGDLFGSFGKQSYTVNCRNLQINGTAAARNWHYFGGGGNINGLRVDQCRALFFTSAPASAKNLEILNTDWGFGIDSTSSVTVTLSGSSATRVTVQRANNIFNLLDFLLTEWVGVRSVGAAVTGAGFRFQRKISMKAGGPQAASTAMYVLGADGSSLASSTADATGVAPEAIATWGFVSATTVGAVSDTATAAAGKGLGKITAADVASNAGDVHDAGAYKLPLTVQFLKYGAKLASQSGITFDLTSTDIKTPLVLSPVVEADENIAFSAIEANALLPKFLINIVDGVLTITMLENTTLKAAYHVMHASKRSATSAVYRGWPSVQEDWAEMVAGNLVTTANFVISEGVTLSAEGDYIGLQTTGTITNNGTLAATFTDSNNAGSIAVVGVLPDETVEMHSAIDNGRMESRTGPGTFSVPPWALSVNADPVYFVRLSGGNVIASSILTPVKLVAGVNPEVPLYTGPEVQIAQAARLELLPTLVEIEASTKLAKEASVQLSVALSA